MEKKKKRKRSGGCGRSEWVMKLPLLSLVIFFVFMIVYLFSVNAKVHTIDDNEELFSRMNETVPSSMYVENPVWGMTRITDMDLLFEFHDFINSLPTSGGIEERRREEEEGLKGILYFNGGQNLEFSIGRIIRVNGIPYGDGLSRRKIEDFSRRIRASLYTKENLSDMISHESRVRVRREGEVKNLATDQKYRIKNLIARAGEVEVSGLKWENSEIKKKVFCQVEIFTEEDSVSPEVYIVVYESGLSMVYDSYGSRSGSIMQLMMDEMEFVNMSKLDDGGVCET